MRRKKEYRLQQIKSKWRENGRVKDAAQRLSPECRDLLDHIFDLNEKRRMSIAGRYLSRSPGLL